MSAKRDYYEILGLDKKATDASIKKAYRKLAKKYHPDSNPNDKEAEKRFKEVTEAYNVLSDKEKKKLYDQFGHAGLDPNGPFANGGAYGTSGNYTGAGGSRNLMPTEAPMELIRNSILKGGDMNDIFGDMFGDIFHHGHSGSSSDRYRNFHSTTLPVDSAMDPMAISAVDLETDSPVRIITKKAKIFIQKLMFLFTMPLSVVTK